MSNDFYIQYILPYSSIIIKICRAYTNSNQDYEDYYQEVCLQIWKSKENFKENSLWSTWIYKVTLNVCLSLNRQKKKNLDFKTLENTPEIDFQNDFEYKDKLLNKLHLAIKKLSEIDRAIILLYLEGNSHNEIASIINTNPNNIGVRINRIKTRLKKIIENGK